MTDSIQVLVLVILLSGMTSCSDPDQVPETHRSLPPTATESKAQEPAVKRYVERTALFGDLHVHTSWSADAYTGGNRLGPNSAYRFARGEAVELPSGVVTKLETPLDFVALTDHAEGFGAHLACTTKGGPEFDLAQCRDIRSGDMDQDTMLENAFSIAGTRPMPRDPVLCADLTQCKSNERTTWQRIQESANAHNDPGTFTTLIGYEFSSLLNDFGMLHRNVIFRGSEVIPSAISAMDVTHQADFFAQLDAACSDPCEVLTIPHNTNYSWGLTFSRTNEDGSAYSTQDLQRRARIERLFEITQQKGNSECQISVGASDEDCDFGNLFPPCKEGQLTRCTKPGSMYRNVLLDGLSLRDEEGFNPYKLGVIGSTDTHTSSPGNTRSSTPGQFAGAEGIGFATKRIFEMNHIVMGPVRKMSAGGLAAVWADSNTRADIFDALRRREAFATSGSRMRIRFFAGDYPDDLGTAKEPVTIAYANGVPMGSDLSTAQVPRFWVWASQDPLGPALDRIQIIKGWTEGENHRQKVWDIACSGGRTPDLNGKCPATSANVDLTTCQASGTAGAQELQATFKDPEYSAEKPAFYYARVFEDPSCRWTTRMANRADVDMPSDVPPTIQQRGWSSPIWVGR